MDLRQLRHFVALAKHLNFTRAAQESCITQSAFSRSIQGLEHELGVPLVERNNRGTLLTAKGEALRARAHQLLEAADNLRDDLVLQPPQAEHQVLSFGTGVLPTARLLPQAIARFVQRYPQVKIDMRCQWLHDLLAMLDDGQISFLVADLRHIDIGTRHLVRPLRFRHFGLFCREGHPLLRRARVAFDDLADHPLIGSALPYEIHHMLLSRLSRGALPLNLECLFIDMLPTIIGESDAIGIAPLEVLDPLLASGNFQRLQCHDEPDQMRDGGACLGLVQLHAAVLPAPAQYLADAILHDEAQRQQRQAVAHRGISSLEPGALS
ncbi:DNA-binding transcriptional regulator, LysR family [Pseudomonas flavescens]|uniref:DNA-binding transcriptional regulator, LysR family n=1 Tax=Phytopseudomonas flavescens TaxID=29435 RepID=A0A1G8G0R8_9GAMM|nr:LysR family transcriptional regulator [Pseudomonas flavescens]SDH87962.1 DNA-binding transcriptional regulator, LysR family [Pseudomonas flavescens]